MSLAFVVLMPEGVVAYRNHLLLDSLSPIMSNGIKAKKRTIHLTLQVRVIGPKEKKKGILPVGCMYCIRTKYAVCKKFLILPLHL